MNNTIVDIISADIRRVAALVAVFAKLFIGSFVILGAAGAAYILLPIEGAFYFAVFGLVSMYLIKVWGHYLGLP